MHIHDSVAIVTGANSGLGAATSAVLSARGAQVFGWDLTPPDSSSPGVHHATVDVTDGESVQAALFEAAQAGPLRIVVNCAGIASSGRILSRHGPHDLALFARVVAVNLIGTFNVMALASEVIAQTEPLGMGQRGIIVNTASIAAQDGQVGQAAYASSKAGVVGLTLPAARDLAQHGIRVNTIAPGLVDTPMMAAFSDEVRAALADDVPFPRRLARPEEFAQLVAAVITHDYINGETIRMDGALRMAPR